MFNLHRSKPRGRRYGWVPDHPDARDYPYKMVRQKIKLPQIVDLREGCTPVEDQGSLGSCTANALVGAFEYLDKADGGTFVDWSRLFLYYNERKMQGWENEDSGAFLRDGIKSLVSDGICDEALWPYNVKKFAKKPCASQYEEAKGHVVESYFRIQTLEDMQNCLASGWPFVFGFTVYESFNHVGSNGKVNMPLPDERALGGHAVCAVGYDMKREVFIVRNSWGALWGDKGYFYMPFDYLSDKNLSDDFWAISKAKV